MEEQKLYTSIKIIKRLLSNHIKPYKKLILIAIICMIIVASLSTVIVMMSKIVINKIFIIHDSFMLIVVPLVTIGLFFSKAVAEYYQNYLIKLIGQGILRDIQLLMYRHLLFSDLEFLQKFPSGKIISRFTNDISSMRTAVSSCIVGIARHFVTVVFLVCYMFILEPFLSLLVFVVFPISVYPVQKLGRKMRKFSYMNQENLSNYVLQLDETFKSIKVVKSYQAENYELSRAEKITKEMLRLFTKVARVDSLTSPIMEILSGIAMSAIILYGGILIIRGETTPGSIIAFMTAFASAYRPFKGLLSLNVTLQEGLSAAKRVFFVLDIVPNIKNCHNAIIINSCLSGIEFINVYLSLNKKLILENINFVLSQGETIALVGESGSGKTSIANLMMRFYDPSRGNIKLGELELKEIDISSLRQHVTLVAQETMLFDASVAENISYGDPNVTMEQIIDAAKRSFAHEFIINMPEGYKTMVGHQGYKLSGGQRQRLSIARALIKNAPILILDEATSALDQSIEASIYKSIRDCRRHQTNIIITHRINMIINVDKIVVLKHGRVVECGTHDELLKNRYEYYRLYHKKID